jgi:hypothetical protein
MYKEAQAAPSPPQLDALVLSAAVMRMIIRLLSFLLPPPFFLGWWNLYFYEDFPFRNC